MKTWSIFLLLFSVSHRVPFLNLLEPFGSEACIFLIHLLILGASISLSFMGTVVAFSILCFLQSQYLALSHITLDGCTSQNLFAMKATPYLFLSFL